MQEGCLNSLRLSQESVCFDLFMAFEGLINQEETIKRVDQKSMPFVAKVLTSNLILYSELIKRIAIHKSNTT